MHRFFAFLLSTVLIAVALQAAAVAQTTEISYQGLLNQNGSPANGNYDFELALFDSAMGGSQVGALNTRINVSVSNGSFTLSLNFGDQFPGADRFLEIRVRPSGGGAYTPLAPRQKIASAPYAVQSVKAANAVNATTATNALSLGGVAAGQYVLTGDARLSNARNPLPNSPNYVQNTTMEQSSSNFFISGNGRASIFDASTQFNLGGARVLFATSSFNTFTGFGSGVANTTGNANSFFGYESGKATTLGFSNSFFGASAGVLNTTGSSNSAFGNLAGWFNTTGENNTFLGLLAGGANVDGSGNTFLGTSADALFPNLTNASAIGFRARVGLSNSLVLGSINGVGNATADTNVGIGTTAPTQRLHVVGNGLFSGNLTVTGTFTGNVNASGITGVLGPSNGGTGVNSVGAAGNFLRSNGTIWSSSAIAPTDIPAGSAFYIQNGTALQGASNFNISGTGTAGIINAATQFNLAGNRVMSVAGTENIFTGIGAGQSNSSGTNNAFFGYSAGSLNAMGTENAFIGSKSGVFNSTGSFNSFVGSQAGYSNGIGSANAFFGYKAGYNNTTGETNTFFGFSAGYSNISGSRNLFVGYGADSDAGNLTNASAIGARAFVTQNNSLVLGSIAGVNSATANTSVGIGTTAPQYRLDIRAGTEPGLRVEVNDGTSRLASFGSFGSFEIDATNVPGGRFIVKQDGKVGINTASPQQSLQVNGNEILSTGFQSGFKFRERNSASSADDWVLFSEAGIGRIWRFGTGDIMTFTSGGLVGIDFLGAAGSTALCRNASSQISTCSSSARYKSNITGYSSGLDLIQRLRPVSFNWKDGGMPDFGLVAEEVAAIEPLLTTTNSKGEIEGVKYDRLAVVAVNAINEQQTQIERLKRENARLKSRADAQEARIDSLRKLVCEIKPESEVCKRR